MSKKKTTTKKQAKKTYCCTSIDDFKLQPKSGCILMKYDTLSKNHREWIDYTFAKLLEKAPSSESVVDKILEESNVVFYRQAYFRIDGNDYFLDFYIPGIRCAVEIDGKSHFDKKDEDRERDKNFSKIGIATLRVKDNYVSMENFKTAFVFALKATAARNNNDIFRKILSR